MNQRKRWYRLLTIGQKKLLVLLALAMLVAMVAVAFLISYSLRAGQYDVKQAFAGSGASTLYDCKNQAIASLQGETMPFVSWEELPQNLINAFVAREDETFFSHDGIVWSSVLRSALRNLISFRYEQGASTITMQLTRNVFELQEKTLDRKMLEAMLAQRLEKEYDKRTILTQYLNRIYYGNRCYGIRAAASCYFAKNVNELDLGECATLAGLVRAPSLFNPLHSMESAIAVRNETLARMLELEMITQAQYDEVSQAPLVLNGSCRRQMEEKSSSYATMWAKRELEGLQSWGAGSCGEISVVSSLDLSLQQYLEHAVEEALCAVEHKNRFPEAWLALLNQDAAVAQKAAFIQAKRPQGLKVRGDGNDMRDVLQCCALVVDARNTKRGNILAVVAGRSVVDGVDRWRNTVYPGRAAAPLLFSTACLPGGDEFHIVARSTAVTGNRLGYDVVRHFYDSLELDTTLPDREHAEDLYNGLFPITRLDLARLLFDIQHWGRGYQLSFINTIWNGHKKAVYVYEPERAPEYIRRESAVAVSRIPPFIASEGSPVILNETLPEGYGQWTMVCHPGTAAVFVWMGFDRPEMARRYERELRSLLPKASLYLGKEVLAYLRAERKQQRQQKK